MAHRRTNRRPDHRMPRTVKRTPNRNGCESRKLTLCLWSAGGELVTRLDAWGSLGSAPRQSIYQSVRYDRLDAPVTKGLRVVHYQASVIQSKVSA